MLDFTSTRFIFIVLWYVLLYSLTISANLSIYLFFDIKVINHLSMLFFKNLENLVLNKFLYPYSANMVSLNSLGLSDQVLFGLRLGSSKLILQLIVKNINFHSRLICTCNITTRRRFVEMLYHSAFDHFNF